MKVEQNKKMGPVVLAILDGWGLTKETRGNAVASAKTPVMNSLYKKYPNTTLNACGRSVGLEIGHTGNSEAGHMNIGAGRIVEQDAVIISKAINNGTFFKNPAFAQAIQHANKNKSNIHLLGLLSDGFSPHSDNDHLLTLISFFLGKTKANIYLHLFTDGRDSPKFSALKVLDKYKNIFNTDRVKVATIMGRFYAMDRKKAWERTEAAYNAIVLGEGYHVKSAMDAVNQAYNRDSKGDEFIIPSVVYQRNKPIGPISDNDAIVFFNLRSDRARQLTKTFGQEEFEKKNPGSFKRRRVPKNLSFVALTDFGPDLKNVITAFPGIVIPDTIVAALKGKRQLYISETEKYAHVTYFINGGYDHSIVGEDRVHIPSKNVPSYDKKPEMSTREISRRVIKELVANKYDFITLNFAAPDMVGHTGNLEAGIKAVEVVDEELGKIIKTVLAKNGCVVVIADHGNVEEMINLKTGEVDTEHSMNLVPFIIVGKQNYKLMSGGKLANVAPTILDIMKVAKPRLMTAKSLIKR